MHYYTVYKITNVINNKIYIGKHQTKKLDDNYMGSGKRLRDAIKHYGIENFKKEILFIFDNENDMNSKEAELVTEEFVKETTNYNMCPGGNGGFGYINSSGIPKFKDKKHSEESKKKMGHLGNKYGIGNDGGRLKRIGQKRQKIKCVHCGNLCSVNMYPRYHGDNCKLRV